MSDFNLDENYDFGFSMHSDEELEKPSIDRAQAMYNMILPLINNLLVDADKKPNIKWPNRRKILEDFKKKLEQILNGEDTKKD